MNIMKGSRVLSVAVIAVAALSFATPKPAHAVDAGTAVGIGLGAAALGAAVGSAANPYNPYYYPPGYAYPAPAPGYYYPAAPYYPRGRCWDPYRRYYYAC
jgi:hypothetical protein